MKKILSVLLSALVLLAAVPPAIPASAAQVYYPNIHLRGNGYDIIDEDGKVVYDFDVSADQIKDIAKRVLPLLMKGLITNDLDDYYEAAGKEMRQLYDHALLDKNGDPQYGTNIAASLLEDNQKAMQQNRKEADGHYGLHAYTFNYDWRLDPLETADGLNEYINGILAATGAEKVNINASCLGGSPLMAYLSKYGGEKLNAIGFMHSVCFGSELVDETFSGHMNIDANAVARFEEDYFVQNLLKDKLVLKTFLDETVTLLEASGGLERVTTAFMRGLYDRLYEGLTPAAARSSFATWPSYWSMVTAGKYEYARNFIFGEPGSDTYNEYAGLIEKLDRYDREVRQRIPEILKEIKNSSVKVAVIARYGMQMPPVVESADETGDVWLTVRYASIGATASKIGTTLSDDYLAARRDAGYGKYLSPDRQIDASTCLFPDYTWFIKGAIHNDEILDVGKIFENVFNSTDDVTVDTFAAYPQFMVYDRETTAISPMTEDNMNVETYPVDEAKPGLIDRLRTFFTHLGAWFNALFALLKTL